MKSEIILDHLTFEARYSFGHLYWDRCGQTIYDIESNVDGWFGSKSENNIGRLENPEKRMIVVYNDSRYNLFVRKPDKLDIDTISKELHNTWKIIKSNFGLDEFNRLACRFQYLLPTKSVEESESLLKRADLNVISPEYVKDSDFDIKIRHLITTFEKEDLEYRVELKGVTRSEAIDPSNLYKGRPEALPRKQREYRLLKEKQFREYSANPMYAVLLDIDCVKYDPEELDFIDFYKKQLDVVEKYFLRILEAL